MQLKIIGAVLIFTTCSGFGFYIAALYRSDARCLLNLIHSLNYMSSELQYRMTPLPQLMRQTADQCSDKNLRQVFLQLSHQLEDKYCSDFSQCMETVLRRYGNSLPKRSLSVIYELSRTMGRFDIDGQISAIMTTKTYCLNEYNMLSNDLSSRLRGCRTLGICAGAAMVILFI